MRLGTYSEYFKRQENVYLWFWVYRIRLLALCHRTNFTLIGGESIAWSCRIETQLTPTLASLSKVKSMGISCPKIKFSLEIFGEHLNIGYRRIIMVAKGHVQTTRYKHYKMKTEILVRPLQSRRYCARAK